MPYPFLKRWMRVSALTKNRSAKRYRCECVALILFASRSADWLASLAAGAERLVPLSVVGEPARACSSAARHCGSASSLPAGSRLRPDACRPDRRNGHPRAGLGRHRIVLARRDCPCRVREPPGRDRPAAAAHRRDGGRACRGGRPVVAAGAACGHAAGRKPVGSTRSHGADRRSGSVRRGAAAAGQDRRNDGPRRGRRKRLALADSRGLCRRAWRFGCEASSPSAKRTPRPAARSARRTSSTRSS